MCKVKHTKVRYYAINNNSNTKKKHTNVSKTVRSHLYRALFSSFHLIHVLVFDSLFSCWTHKHSLFVIQLTSSMFGRPVNSVTVVHSCSCDAFLRASMTDMPSGLASQSYVCEEVKVFSSDMNTSWNWIEKKHSSWPFLLVLLVCVCVCVRATGNAIIFLLLTVIEFKICLHVCLMYIRIEIQFSSFITLCFSVQSKERNYNFFRGHESCQLLTFVFNFIQPDSHVLRNAVGYDPVRCECRKHKNNFN